MFGHDMNLSGVRFNTYSRCLNCQSLINRLAAVTSYTVHVHSQNGGVTNHIQKMYLKKYL